MDLLFWPARGGQEHAADAVSRGEPKIHALKMRPPVAAEADGWADRVASILSLEGAAEGYAVAWGVGTGRLIEELAKASSRPVIAVDADPQKVFWLRQRMDAAGWYGPRVAAQVGDPDVFPFPPYLANLIVVETPATGRDRQFLQNLYRPCDLMGVWRVLRIPADRQKAFARAVATAGLPRAEVGRRGEFALLRRVGPLPGSANWTHQYADAANSSVSRDQLVKAPLGLLWFGGPRTTRFYPATAMGRLPRWLAAAC